MAKSRYNNFSKVRSNNSDYYRLETFPSISAQDLEGIPHSIFMWKETDRMDAMAESFFGDPRYWCIICLMNNYIKILPGIKCYKYSIYTFNYNIRENIIINNNI